MTCVRQAHRNGGSQLHAAPLCNSPADQINDSWLPAQWHPRSSSGSVSMTMVQAEQMH
jgi:hypothetical protein